MTNLKSDQELRGEWNKDFDFACEFQADEVRPDFNDPSVIANWWLGKMAEQRKEMVNLIQDTVGKEKDKEAVHCGCLYKALYLIDPNHQNQ